MRIRIGFVISKKFQETLTLYFDNIYQCMSSFFTIFREDLQLALNDYLEGAYCFDYFVLVQQFRYLKLRLTLFVSLFIRRTMGNLTHHNNFTIAITAPEAQQFNFHRDYNKNTEEQNITFPSFISRNDKHHIKYCSRSNYNQRQFELQFQEEDNTSTLILKKTNGQVQDVWKNLNVNEAIPLVQGCVLKIGDVQLEFKKLCKSFADLEEWEETLKTVSDADPREKSFAIMNSVNMKNSKYSIDGLQMLQSRKVQNINQSMISSIGFDQEGQFCRYCYGKDNTRANPLLNLCKCSGSVKFSHYYCLKNWISSRSKTKISDCYEYSEYDVSCEVCKEELSRTTTLKGKKYVLYSESMIHPPFIVMTICNKDDSATRIQEYIINFDYTPTIKIGKGSGSDIRLKGNNIANDHCELSFEHGEFLLKNRNPTYGTFIRVDKEWNFSPVDNQLELMIGNHLIRIKEQSRSCLWNQALKLRVKESEEK